MYSRLSSPGTKETSNHIRVTNHVVDRVSSLTRIMKMFVFFYTIINPVVYALSLFAVKEVHGVVGRVRPFGHVPRLVVKMLVSSRLGSVRSTVPSSISLFRIMSDLCLSDHRYSESRVDRGHGLSYTRVPVHERARETECVCMCVSLNKCTDICRGTDIHPYEHRETL